MHNYLLTSTLWLEALVKKEVQRQGYTITEVQDKAIYFEWEIEAIARMNLWSRFGNILYLVFEEQKNMRDFDTYFDTIYNLDWKKHVPSGYEVHIKATAIKSELWAPSTLQALAKKAIVKSLVGDNILREDSTKGTLEVRILMENNTLRVLLNTSGKWLHKRGYREMTGEAPIKENIAAALVILSQWKFREPLYDVFCGSGTIPIEAAMIAKNQAPGLTRSFAFQNWEWVPYDLLEKERKLAKGKEFSGEYTIYASDTDKRVLETAKRNAKFAWVEDCIRFQCMDYKNIIDKQIHGWLVSNPPYGERLEDFDIESIHKDMAQLFAKNKEIQWGVITSHEAFDSYSRAKYKKRKLYNGWELCYFYRKVS